MNFPKLYERFIVCPDDQARIEAFLVDELHGSRILDVGCGTGWLSERLAQHGFKVDAWDANAEMIDYAQAHHAHPNVSYQCADLRTTQPNKTYDAILIINDTLNHLLDEFEVTNALKKFSECLSETGVLVFDVYDPSVLKHFEDEHLEHDQHEDWTFLWSIQAQSEALVHQLSVHHPIEGRRSFEVFERIYPEQVYLRALQASQLNHQRYFDYDRQRRKGIKQVYVGHNS